MKATAELPGDPALPALLAIRTSGLARALPALGLDDHAVQLLLCRYHPGRRAALEGRAGRLHFAVKASAEDPAPEAEVHHALAAAGLAGDSGPRVPPLLAWDRELRVLVIGWLDGPSAVELIESGNGERAGELAAHWLRCAASLEVKLGPPLGAARMMERAHKWANALSTAHPALEAAATAVAGKLASTQPVESAPRLVHGGLYAEHVIDLGDGPGVIDWGRFGQGPIELDAGIFLATTWHLGFRDKSLAAEASRTEEAFLAGTADLLDERALAWHRTAELLRFAKRLTRRQDESQVQAQCALLDEAARLAEAAG
jgi:hypothetical protein